MKLEQHERLNTVLKPGRYTGNEWNSVVKDHAKVDVKFALAFPDIYDVGMSYLGFKILYHILNSREDIVAERTYAPWIDMEEKLRKQKQALTALESGKPLREFDLVGFTLQYEMSYTNILNMLDLAHITKMSCDRTEDEPFVTAGGPGAYHAEPIADFIDFFIVGEGEEIILEICDVYIAWKKAGKPEGRQGFLRRVANLSGIYVPSFYRPMYDEAGHYIGVERVCEEAPAVIHKRIIHDLDTIDYLTKPVMPFVEIVHDRIMLELFRGCSRGCRFCQAGNIYRPVRERSQEKLLEMAQRLVDNTGYDEISLTSLSSSDYSCLHDLIKTLVDKFKPQGVGVSLPSLRIDSFSVDLAKEVAGVRRTGLTFAPEAGTQRMRDVINKGVTEQNLEDAVSAAFSAGWSSVKLYFMIGLPTETDEDLKGIADLAYKVLAIYSRIKGRRDCKVTVSVSSFVPKPHTPFQWEPQNSIEEIQRKQQLLVGLLRDRRIQFNWHDAELSYLEGIMARGDRRLGKVLLKAWELGCKFDGWSDYFKFEKWQQAFTETQIDPTYYNLRQRNEQEVLPWDHLSAGLDKRFLWQEYQQALGAALTVDCRHGNCSLCGVCPNLKTNVLTRGEQ